MFSKFVQKIRIEAQKIDLKESFGNAVRDTQNAVDKLELKGSINNALKATTDSMGSVKLWMSDTHAEYYSIVEKVVTDGLLGIAEDKLKDEEFIEDFFEKSWNVLPAPVQLFLVKKTFLAFCNTKKDLAVSAITQRQKERALLENSSKKSISEMSDEKTDDVLNDNSAILDIK